MVSLCRALGCVPWLWLPNWSLFCDHPYWHCPHMSSLFWGPYSISTHCCPHCLPKTQDMGSSVQEFHRPLEPLKDRGLCWLAFILSRIFSEILTMHCFLRHTMDQSNGKLDVGHEGWRTKGQQLLKRIPYSSQSGAGRERLIFQWGNILYISALTMSFYFPESALKIMLTFMANTLWITIFMSGCIGMKINQWKN